MSGQVVREPRDEDHEDEVEEQFEPRHRAVELELLVPTQGRRLPDSSCVAHGAVLSRSA
jgi:hypothetical protein